MSDQTNVIPVMPDWTLEDFTKTSAPYEWLYQYKDNKFILNQLLTNMQMIAKTLKFPGFTNMWRSFVESNSPLNNPDLINESIITSN